MSARNFNAMRGMGVCVSKLQRIGEDNRRWTSLQLIRKEKGT
jgi:hypothetical protein